MQSFSTKQIYLQAQHFKLFLSLLQSGDGLDGDQRAQCHQRYQLSIVLYGQQD
jgi:hypothetical protein